MRMLVQEYLESVHAQHLANRSGEVAGYIPELAVAEPDLFGVCVATTDGHVYECGDSRAEFTIQSISKPFTYGLALSDHGVAAVAAKLDVEPSGDAFNEISLDPVTGRPRNPMINAGAITSASLVSGGSPAERLERVRQLYSAYAGRELRVNERVFASEHRTGDRNRAIGYMLRNVGIITEPPEEALHVYFGQCSIDVTCHDLSLMAATLANNGVNPRTGERLLDEATVEHVLSVMTTCGMYDGAGAWVTSVGLPAKSGVGGGVIAVLPGQVGIAVFSPRLDTHGNSVRGVATCRTLASGLGLHLMHVTRGARSAVRGSYDLTSVASRRQRSAPEREVLREHGHRVRVIELHGDLHFSGAERVVRLIGQLSDAVDVLIVDATRVDDVSPVALRMLTQTQQALTEAGVTSGLIDPDRVLHSAARAPLFGDVNSALQWCEDLLIDRYGDDVGWSRQCTLSEHPVFATLSAQGRTLLTEALVPVTAADGEHLLRVGEPPSGIYLILDGQVRASTPQPNGTMTDLATFPAGSSFGVLATFTGEPAATDIVAEGPVTLRLLPLAKYQELRAHHPALLLELIEAILGGSSNALQRAAAALA